ncbi:MAG: hypothetical protein JWO03_437 [Bacteroidetes bacterium]|nr:hypothetical protein [Bacteroidota bacterium]
MRKLLTPLIIILTALLCAQSAFSQAGMLDPSYGDHGKANTRVANGGILWGMSTIDGWSVVVGGLARNNSDSDFAVSKYTRDGRPDSSFGVNGVAITQMGPGADVVYGTMIQPDGKVIAAGMAWSGTKYNFAVARYTAAGVLDTTFGDHGRAITSLSPYDNIGTAIGTQDGWSIVVGGMVSDGSTDDFGLVRYTRDGIVDSTFGVNGIVVTDLLSGSDDDLAAIAIAADSGIVAGGTTYGSGSTQYFSLARYTRNGALDNNFGTSGRVVHTGSADDETYAVALQPDGKVVIGGYSTNGTNDDFGLLRLMADGSVDNSFGTNGHVITAVGDSDEAMYSLLVQPDGRIIAAGSSIDSNGQYRNALIRYNADGTADHTFGTDGIVAAKLSSSDNEIYAVKLETDGKIVTAGYANDGTDDMFSMARYLTDLTLGVIDLDRNSNSVLIYPNPVAQDATLQYTLAKDEQVSIRIIDAQGKVVSTLTDSEKQLAGDHVQPLMLSASLASGTYTIAISSPSGQMSVRIVK